MINAKSRIRERQSEKIPQNPIIYSTNLPNWSKHLEYFGKKALVAVRSLWEKLLLQCPLFSPNGSNWSQFALQISWDKFQPSPYIPTGLALLLKTWNPFPWLLNSSTLSNLSQKMSNILFSAWQGKFVLLSSCFFKLKKLRVVIWHCVFEDTTKQKKPFWD